MLVPYYPELTPLKEFADEYQLSAISRNGWGVEMMIAHEQALNEKGVLASALGIRRSDDGKIVTNATRK
jgi:hypothetical protein